MNRNAAILESVYRGFNTRDMEAVLSAMHPDVVWANGLEGGYVYGHEGVRNYWTRQWATIDSHAKPVRYRATPVGAVAVHVELIAYDMQGNLLFDDDAVHVFHLEDGLITRFDIEQREPTGIA